MWFYNSCGSYKDLSRAILLADIEKLFQIIDKR